MTNQLRVCVGWWVCVSEQGRPSPGMQESRTERDCISAPNIWLFISMSNVTECSQGEETRQAAVITHCHPSPHWKALRQRKSLCCDRQLKGLKAKWSESCTLWSSGLCQADRPSAWSGQLVLNTGHKASPTLAPEDGVFSSSLIIFLTFTLCRIISRVPSCPKLELWVPQSVMKVNTGSVYIYLFMFLPPLMESSENKYGSF